MGMPLSPYPLPVRSSRGEGEDHVCFTKAWLPRPMTKEWGEGTGRGGSLAAPPWGLDVGRCVVHTLGHTHANATVGENRIKRADPEFWRCFAGAGVSPGDAG